MEQFLIVTFLLKRSTVNTFKWRFDKFRSDQDVLYNYKADLHDIGNRSTIVLVNQ